MQARRRILRRGTDTRPRILIVEDEFLIAAECETILSAAGYVVVGIAADADQAMALADLARPDLVLMDIKLAGGSDGIEAAKALRATLGTRSLFTSAYADDATRRRADAAEPLGWLAKPYSPQDLLAAVTEAVDGSG